MWITDQQRLRIHLAREINDACERLTIACGPPRATLVPSWRDEYLGDAIDASRAVFATLVSLGNPQPHVAASRGSEQQLALFARITNDRLGDAGDVSRSGIRLRMAQAIAKAQGKFAAIAVPTSMAAWVVLLLLSATLRRWHMGHVLCAALVAAIVARVGLLGFLEATAIPSNNMLYLSPVVPMALALPFCVVFLAFALRERQPADTAAAGNASAIAPTSAASQAHLT